MNSKEAGSTSRMVAWAIKLTEYDITYAPRNIIKSQLLAYLLIELSSPHLRKNAQVVDPIDGNLVQPQG